MGITINSIDEAKKFLGMEKCWNTLLDNSLAESVFLRHEWFSAWWDAFGKGSRLFIVTAKENGELIGIAPLRVVRERFRGVFVNKIKFMSNEHSSRCDFIIAKGKEQALNAIMEFIFKQHLDWDMMEFCNIEEAAPSVDALTSGLIEYKRLFGINSGLCSPYILVEERWDDFLKKRSSRFRKNIRTKNNRLKKIKEVEIKEVKDSGVFEDIIAISENSWKSKVGKSLADSKSAKDFFKNLSKAAESLSWLSIWIMSIEGRPAAYEYHLKFNGKISGLRADYDEAYKSLSAGSLLDYHIVKNIFNFGGIKEYDLGGSSDFYKRNWTERERKHVNLLVFNKNFLGRVGFFSEFVIVAWMKKIITPIKVLGRKIADKVKFEGAGGLRKMIFRNERV